MNTLDRKMFSRGYANGTPNSTVQPRLDSMNAFTLPGQTFNFDPNTMNSGSTTLRAKRTQGPDPFPPRSPASMVPGPNQIYDSKNNMMHDITKNFLDDLFFKGFNAFNLLKDDSLIKGSNVALQLESYREANEPFNLSKNVPGVKPRDVGSMVLDTGIGALKVLEPYAKTLAATVGELKVLPGSEYLRSLDDDVSLGFDLFDGGFNYRDKSSSLPSNQDRSRFSLAQIGTPVVTSDVMINQNALNDAIEAGFDPSTKRNLADAKAKGFVPPETSVDDAKLPASFDMDGILDFAKGLPIKLLKLRGFDVELKELEDKQKSEDKPEVVSAGKISEDGKDVITTSNIKPTIGQEGEITDEMLLSEEEKYELAKKGNVQLADEDGNINEFDEQGAVVKVNGKPVSKAPSANPLDPQPLKGKALGASLADMFQKISAVPNVKNTLDLLQGGAQTYSALNLAEEAAEKKDTRAYQAAIAKELAKAKAALNAPRTIADNDKILNRSQELDQNVTDFKNTSQNLALIDQLMDISQDPNIKGWRGFVGKLTDQTAAFLAAGGETEKSFDQLAPRVQFEKLMTIVSQKNIKDILNETGKTISNIDRDIVDRIMGKITVFTNPAETLKSLQLAREDSLKNLESYRNKSITLIGFLNEYGVKPGSAQKEPDILRQLYNFDRKSYQSNLSNSSFASGSGVSYAGAPVYDLNGQLIQR